MIRNVTEHSVDLSRYIAISSSLRREEREREKNGVLKYIGDIKARFAAAADWTRGKQARKDGGKKRGRSQGTNFCFGGASHTAENLEID